jgi:hypothetical protein
MRNTKVKMNTQNNLPETSVSSKNDNFEFDLWAAQVRRQLLAALKSTAK